jgi:hypothetical protein
MRPIGELERMLRDVRDRMERADTMEAALADAYDEQEISAALQDLGQEVKL